MSIQETEVLGVPWWYVVRDYATKEEAKYDFDRVNRKVEELDQHGLAGYRILDDMPERGGTPRRVVMLGANKDRVLWAAAELQGRSVRMEAEVVYGLILRYVQNAERLEMLPGHFTHRYGEGGLAIHPDGSVTPLPTPLPTKPSTEPDVP